MSYLLQSALNEMNSWKINYTNRIIYFAILLIVSFFVFSVLVIRGQREIGGTFSDSLFYMAIGFSPFILAWLLTFPRSVLQKKIPIKIDYNDESEKIILWFSGNKKISLSKSEVAYSLFNYNNYSILVFYKNIKSTKGHIITKEFMNIVGLKYGPGWKPNVLIEIKDFFNSRCIQEYNGKDKSFLNRILWNN